MRAGLGIAVIAFVLVGGLGGLLAVDALAVRSALEAADDSVEVVMEQAGSGDVAAASTTLESVRDDLQDPVMRTNRLLWRAGEQVPVVGPNLEAARGVAAVSDRASRLGHGVLGSLAPLVDDDGALRVDPEDGQLPVEVLTAVADVADGLDTAGLDVALSHLRTVRGSLVAEVAEARERALHLGDELSRAARRSSGVLAAVPTVLGNEGPRRYLIGMQNPAELRGTGGLLGFTAVLTTDAGVLELSDPTSRGGLDTFGGGTASLEATDEPDAYEDRYRVGDGALLLSNANLHPDLPTVAPKLLAAYEAATGDALDGVILVDPVAVARLLAEVGPIDVTPGVAATAPDLPNPVPPERFADIAMTEHYASFAQDNEGRRAYLEEVAAAAFTAVFDGGWDGAAMTTAVVDVASAGHLAIFDRDESVQAGFGDSDLVGALAPPSWQRGDLLAVTANNSAGNKLDRLVEHRLRVDVDLSGDPGSGALHRAASMELDVRNEVDAEGLGLYVAGSFPIGEGGRPPRAAGLGISRTWFSFWAPQATRLWAEGDAAVPGSAVLEGLRVADAVVEAGVGTTAGAVASGDGPVTVRRDGDNWVYDLDLRRPPKAISDALDLSVRVPDGWHVVETTVTGGQADIGLPGGLEVSTDEQGVSVTGAMNSPLRLQVVLGRA